VLGELTRQQQAHGGLDLPARDGGALVVVGQTASLGGDALEDVVDERVHDAHGLAGHTGVGVDLLQHLIDVDGIALLPPALLSLLVRLRDVLLGLARFLGGLSTGLGRHDERRSRDETGKNLGVPINVFVYMIETMRRAPQQSDRGICAVCTSGAADWRGW